MNVRDGLNLYPMEYTYAQMISSLKQEQQENINSDDVKETKSHFHNPGVLIISEFVSSARPMQGGLIVNPWKIDEV